jgi:hypothetical protein
MARGKQTPEPDIDLSRLRKVETGPAVNGSTSKVAEILTVAELAPYAAHQRIFTEIDSLKDGPIGAPVRDATFGFVIREGIRLGKAPKNPKGVDGNQTAEASLQIRKKDGRTVVEGETLDRLNAAAEKYAKLVGNPEFKLPIGRKTYAPNTLRMKPDLFKDKSNLKKVLAALDAAGIDWTDMFEEQVENSYAIVGDDTIDAIFAMVKAAREKAAADKANEVPFPDSEVRELLELVCSVSIRVEQYYGDLPSALEVVRKRLCPTAKELAEAEAAAKKAAAAAAPATKPTGRKTRGDSLPTESMAGMFSHTGRDAERLAARSQRGRR